MTHTPQTSTPIKGERRPYILLAIFAIALVYLIAFALLNTAQVQVSFVIFATTTSLIWLMLASVILGLILGAIGAFWLTHRRRRSH